MKILQKPWLILLLVFVSGLAYLLLGYSIPRENFAGLLACFAILFAIYFYFLKSPITVKNCLLLALGFRLILLVATPALSDDYFRFLWDGHLLLSGENPFLHLPAYYAENNFLEISGLNETLFAGLNSPNYYSVYPPVCQFVFALAGTMSAGNLLPGIILMRVVIILAELTTCWLLLRLLAHFKLPAKQVLWYALNPLVILELTGNLHFEALVITFTLAAFYFLTRNRYRFSAVLLGIAVSTKLIPLLVLPFIFNRLGLKKGLTYCLITGFTFLVLFLPFVTPALISDFGSSLNLYFQKFEFNASVYYIFRWLGFYFYGYNQIAKIGVLLSVSTFLAILLLAYRERSPALSTLSTRFLQALTIFYLLATIVHPWYLTTLVAMAVLSRFRYPLIWSGLAVLSYSAYQTKTYAENPWLLMLEYSGLAITLILEFQHSVQPKSQLLKRA